MSLEALALGGLAFCLGSCPFSLWIAQRFMHKDIREYGEGNPGCTNVFRAGGRRLGVLAFTLDTAKGTPFVALSHYVYHLPEQAVLAVGLCAIMGSAFSPILHFRGGKSLAIAGGVLLATPNRDIFFIALVLIGLGFLLHRRAAWVVTFSASAITVYLIATGRSPYLVGFMACLLLLVVYKHRAELHTTPKMANCPPTGSGPQTETPEEPPQCRP